MAQGKKWTTEAERLEARRASHRAYRERNAVRLRETYEARKPDVMARNHKYYMDNAERIKAQARKYRTENADKIAAWNSNPEVRERKAQYSRDYRNTHAGPPLPYYWPYGETEWPVDVVNSIVSREFPEDIRADICQELCLLLVEGEDAAVLPSHIQRIRGELYGRYSTNIDRLLAAGWDVPLEVWV